MSPPRLPGKRRNGLLIGKDGKTWAERAESRRQEKNKIKRRAKNPALPPIHSSSSLDPTREERIRLLDLECKRLRKMALDTAIIREEIFKLAESEPSPPRWVIDHGALSKNSPGVPTLLASDWHWGEVVNPAEIGGVNKYNLEIAHRRAKALVTNTIDLLRNHIVNPKYPGIVLALGGDMVSGNIHDELTQTNESPIMPVVLDLLGVLIECVDTLADEFGNVFIPAVTGNHGRTTKKIPAKQRAQTNYDWLIYCFLRMHFKKDKRISFLVPDGPDALYRVFNHRYLLTHGDQFRGGDGIIGVLGPIIRGDHRKRSRNGQINQEYDTILLGHFHQLIQMQRVILNSSLKGYDEYSYRENYAYEVPKQALWITHPTRGITIQMPVLVDPPAKKTTAEWVSVMKGVQ